jgi:signal transduction histidine kinase
LAVDVPAWLDVVPTAMVIIDRDTGVLRFANQEATKLSPPTSTIERPTIDRLLGAGAREAAIAAALEGNSQELASGTSGAVRYLLDARAVPDDPPTLVVTIRDLSEQRRVDKEIADLARFPEKNPGPVLWFDRSGTVLLANAAARRHFGETLVGSNWLEVCPGFDEDRWNAIRSADDVITLETEVGDRWFSIAYVRSDADAFVFAFGTDITRRREMEQRVLEYARFPDMNPGPVLRLDLEGNVLLANAAARAVFATEVVGQCWFDIYPGSRERWEEIVAAHRPISLEARIDDGDFVFAHRSDPETQLVFVFGADITHQKQAEGQLRQSEKMATLGTLVAGVAHELNNPAAATRRAADQLRDAFTELEAAHLELAAAEIGVEGRDRLAALDMTARSRAGSPTTLDSLARSDLEADIEDWLDEHGIADDLDVAPHLVELGIAMDELDELASAFGAHATSTVLRWLAAAFPVYRLAYAIGEGSARISEIVAALKGYSYLGQAPVQAVDVHEGIDNTLIILRSKLKVGVEVRRDYAADVPLITAYGSELNQVWTNLIDNAVDAMSGQGAITIRTRFDGTSVVVEIEDDGPGIPADARSRVFDPFFTTKEPGKGTGLGLATSYSIVVDKHHGSIDVTSVPGQTCFTVRLPLASSRGVDGNEDGVAGARDALGSIHN